VLLVLAHARLLHAARGEDRERGRVARDVAGRRAAQCHLGPYRVPACANGVAASASRRSLTAPSLKSFVEPLQRTDAEIVSRFPRTHIYCAGRLHLVSLVKRGFMRRTLPPREPGWRLRRLRAGHDCLISNARELADLLLEVAFPE